MKKSIKIVFTISIILNVLLLGGITGRMYMKWKKIPQSEIVQELSPEARNKVARVFQSAFREIRDIGGEARKSRTELVNVLSAETFDPQAFDKVAGDLTEQRAKITALKIDVTKKVASELDRQDRIKMARRMSEMVGGTQEKRVLRGHRKLDSMGPWPKSSESAPEKLQEGK